MRQEVTRAHKGWALDSVVVHNEMTKMMKEDVTAPPAEGKKNKRTLKKIDILGLVLSP